MFLKRLSEPERRGGEIHDSVETAMFRIIWRLTRSSPESLAATLAAQPSMSLVPHSLHSSSSLGMTAAEPIDRVRPCSDSAHFHGN
jgi:hypothetical protein